MVQNIEHISIQVPNYVWNEHSTECHQIPLKSITMRPNGYFTLKEQKSPLNHVVYHLGQQKLHGKFGE